MPYSAPYRLCSSFANQMLPIFDRPYCRVLSYFSGGTWNHSLSKSVCVPYQMCVHMIPLPHVRMREPSSVRSCTKIGFKVAYAHTAQEREQDVER